MKLDLEIFDCNEVAKGKGVRAKEIIKSGSFLCEYMGEVVCKNEAEVRFNQRSMLNEPNFILVLREFYSNNDHTQITCIDARNYGNIGRFINHSCDPNLVVIPVRIDNIIPHAAFFALKDIECGQEVYYDYNGGFEGLSNDESKNKCFCMSAKCKGYLPANKF